MHPTCGCEGLEKGKSSFRLLAVAENAVQKEAGVPYVHRISKAGPRGTLQPGAGRYASRCWAEK